MLVKPTDARTDHLDDLTDFVTLERELQSMDPSVRRRAIHSLRQSPSAAMIFCRRLEIEDNASVRAALLTSLTHMKSDCVAARLADLLGSANAGLRAVMIRALASMPNEELPSILQLLGDPDADIRRLTIQIISHLKHPATGGLPVRDPCSESQLTSGMAFTEDGRPKPRLALPGEQASEPS